MTNHGSIANEKSAMTNQAESLLAFVAANIVSASRGTHTSYSQTDLGEIKPAVSGSRRVPSFLDGNTLDDDGDAGEEGDEDRCREENPNEPDLDFVSHDSEEEDADSELAYTDDHEAGHLTEDFEFDGRPVDIRIADLRE